MAKIFTFYNTCERVIGMLQINNLEKTYICHKAISDINLTIPRGEIVGLFGENGAGKSTLLKCILNFLNYNGEILLDGEPITRKNICKFSFATSEHSFFPNISAKAHEEFLRTHFPNFSEKRFNGLIDFFQLPKNTPIKRFSTGQKNQFEVILALSQGADYILMDEPFAGNDIFNREDFYKVLLGIMEPHETVILSTHLIEEVADFISRAILIKKGKIIADITIDEIENNNTSLTDYIKKTYKYKPDRVSKALNDISGTEDQ